jgi:hypothetical protein
VVTGLELELELLQQLALPRKQMFQLGQFLRHPGARGD